MKNYIYIIAAFVCSLSTPNYSHAQLWYHSHGNSADNSGQGIATDGNGNIYITGYFAGIVNFATTTLVGVGNSDVFIAKYSSKGTFLWAKSAGGSGHDEGHCIYTDASGNSYIAGEVSGTATVGSISLTAKGQDILLAKYDSTGSVVWAERFGNWYDDAATGICSDGAGNLYVTGYFHDVLDFGATKLTASGTSADIFIAKFDASNGNCLWAVQAGGSADDYAYAVRYANGNLYLTGEYRGAATIGGAALVSAGSSDVFAAKYDVSGNGLWAVSGGGVTADVGKGITVDASGNVYISGYFSNNAQFGGQNHTATNSSNYDDFWMKYDGSGNFVSFKDVGSWGGHDILVDGAGTVYLAGRAYTINGYGGTSAALCFAQNGNILSVGGYTANQGFDSYVFVAEFAKTTGISTVTTGGTLSVYPNPISSTLTIDGLKTGEQIVVSDVTGYTVLRAVASRSRKVFDVSQLTQGLYFLSSGSQVIRLIKE